MSKIFPQPRVKLSRLRDIGWRHWDPIGLLGSGGIFTGKWDDEDNLSFADEYDRYLMVAAGQLRRGATPKNVVDYLVQIEAEHMGLGVNRSAKVRARDVVNAILADPEIWTWPDENGKFICELTLKRNFSGCCLSRR